MAGLYAAVTREDGMVSAVRQRAGRLLSAAMLSVLVPATIAAAPAAADPIGPVTINGLPARQCGANGGSFPSADYCVGSAPLVTITLPSNSGEPLPDMRGFAVRNDETDGFDEITEIDATLSQNIQDARFKGAFNDSEQVGHVGCAPDSGFTIKCPIAVPAQRGFSASVAYSLRNRVNDGVNYNGGLQSLSIQFNYGGAISPCAGPAAPGGSASQARAADNCTPPSHTRITKAQIKSHSAFFRFKARHASSFECELLRNNKVMFRHSCHSPKPYASRLPRGHYAFILTGVNRAGVDPKPAKKKFTIK